MAFLGVTSWRSDALTSDGQPSVFNPLVGAVRPHLPGPLAPSPSPLLASFTLFLGLSVGLLVFSVTLNSLRKNLISAQAAAVPRRKAGRSLTTLLIGPEQTGKSALYSALVFEAVPETQTSQHENESSICLSVPIQSSSSTLIHLVDLPGHSRIRSRVNGYLPVADKIVFCIDISTAIRGGASKNVTLIEAVETSCKSTIPPSLLVLFTRGDLFPLLAASPYDAKRQAQAVARARTAFEMELGRRRAGMGLGRGSGHHPKTKVASMSQVTRGGVSSSGWFGTLKAMLGFGKGLGGQSRAHDDDDDDDDEADEDLEGLDYVDWAWAQSSGAPGSAFDGASASGFSLDRLDGDVVLGGKAAFAVASLGKERGWASPHGQDAEQSFPGLQDLRLWLADVDAQIDRIGCP